MSDTRRVPSRPVSDARRRPLAGSIRGALVASAGILLAQPFAPRPALAGPTGGQVVAGQGRIQAPDAATTVVHQQSHSLAIDWRSFDVAAGEQVRFDQPSSSAAVLNRVLNQRPSQIFGSVRANGQVFILNAGGVVIGPGARLDVGGLVLSSLDIKNQDFMDGRFTFEARDGETPGAVVNRGLIRAAAGGSVTLLGAQVSNEGTIVADMGHVTLAAGRTATLDFDGDGLIRFEIGEEVLSNSGGAAAAVSNSGEIRAEGGRVTLTARAASRVFDRAVNNSGLVRAGGITRAGGKVLLTGLGGGVSNTGTLDASGAAGGDVTLASDTAVEQLGAVRADGAAGAGGRVRLVSAGETRLGGDSVTRARSQAGAGGTVEVLGAAVALVERASVDASGAAGGGTVRIGGGLHGAVAGVANARTTAVGPDVSVRADATGAGDGGTVIVWADEITRFQGAVSARGADAAGDGGFVEVSGKDALVFAGTVDTRAPAGRTGTLLLDPKNIVIADGGSDSVADNDGFGDNAALDATFDADAVVAALATSSLVLQANTDIWIREDVVGPANGNSLTLQAGRHIVLARTPVLAGDQVDAAATDAGGGVTVTLNGGDFTAVVDDPGAVTDRDPGNAQFFMAAGSGIVTSGGAVTVSAGGGTGNVGGFVLTAVTTDAAAAAPDQPGGSAGAVVVSGPAAVTVGAVSARGGDGNDVSDDGVAQAGGAGGSVTLTSSGATLDVAGIDVRGGAAAAIDPGDAAGGAGGDVSLDTGGGTIGLAAGAIETGGGAGANGGALGAGGAIAIGDPAIVTGGALSLGTGASGGAVTFAATLDSAPGQSNGLVITAGTGAVTFTGAVGAGDPLGAVTVNSAGDLSIGDSFTAAGFSQLAGSGTTTVAGVLTSSGDIGIASGTIDLGAAIDAAGQAVTLAAADSILDGNGGAVNVIAASADLAATTGGIGLGTTLETAVASLVASAATGVAIENTGPVTATLNAAAGAVAFANLAGTVTSGGAWSADAFDVDAAGALILDHAVTANAGALMLATTSGDIVLNAALDARGHDIVIDAAANVSAGPGATVTTSATLADGAAGSVTVSGATGVSLAGAIAAVGDGLGAGGAVTVDAAAGGVAVVSIDASGGAGASTGGAIALNTTGTGGVSAGAGLTSTGGVSGGTIHVGDALTLIADALLTTGVVGGGITLDGDVSGGHVLTLTTGGDLDLSAITLGPVAAELRAFEATGAGQVTLGEVRVDGGLAADPGVGIRVQAGSSILLNGPLITVGGAGGELLIVGGGVDQNGQAITLGAADVVLGGAGGDITISLDDVRAQTITVRANRDIFVDARVDATGGMTPGAFDVVLTADFDGDGAGGVQVRPGGRVLADRNVVVTGSDLFATAIAGDAVVIDADLANEPRIAAGGNVTLQTSASAPAGADIVVAGPVASTGGGVVLFDADDAGGEVRLSADLDSTGGGLRFADALVLAGGARVLTADLLQFDATVDGGAADLTATITNAGSAVFAAAVSNVASLLVTGAATVSADVTASATQSWQSGVTLAGGDPVFTGTTVSFQGAVAGGGNDLTVSGDADIGAPVSGVADLVVSGASTIGADVTTAGTQGWQGPVTLAGGGRTLAGTTVSFGDTLAGGGNALTVSGNAGFDGAVSAVSVLDVSGTAAIGADVATTLTQTWRGAVTLVGGDPQLSATTVSFEGPVTGGGNDLTVTGMAGFGAPVAGVASLLVTGAATVSADVTASATQSWQSGVTLAGGDPVFTGTTVSFQGAVAGGGNDLTVSGDADIGAPVSGVADLVVSGASTIGADVTTAGTQGWQGPVTLAGGGRTLAGTTVSFGDTLAGGGNALTVSGNAGFDGAVSAVSVLDVSGTAAIGADVATTLTQTWRGAVTLVGGGHTLSGSALDFQAPVGTGGNDVTLLFDDVAIGATLDAGAGIVTVDTSTPRAVDLGTQTAGALSLTAAELAAISAGTVRIGSAAGAMNSGITVSAALGALSPVLALRTSGAVDGTGGIAAGALGIAAGAGVTLEGANDVAALAVDAGGAVSFNDTGGFTIASVDGIAGLSAAAAPLTLAAAGGIDQAPGADVVAGLLDVEITGAASLSLLNAGNDVDALIADAGGSVSLRDVDDLTVPGAEEISADGNVALEAGTSLTLAGDIEADSVVLVSGTDLSAPTGVITTDAAGTLTVTSGGVAALGATPHGVSRLAGSSMGALGFTSSGGLFIQAFDTHGAGATVTTTAGDIAGGTLTASSITLDAAAGIGGIGVDTTDSSGPVPVLGALSLASAGDAAAGNIAVTDVSGIARDTSTITVITSGAGVQAVTLRNDAGFGYDADPVAAAPPTFLTLDGDTLLLADATVGASSRLVLQGRTVLAGGARTVGGAGNVVFDGPVAGNGHDLTVNANGAAFTGNVTMGGGDTLALDSPTTLFAGATDLVADNLLLGGGPGSVAGSGSLTILRATPSALDTTLGGADPLFRAANLAALNGFGGTLGIGGTRTVAPAVTQVLNDIVVDGALTTTGDVFLLSAGDVTFNSGSGSISTPGTVTVLALGSASVAGSGNVRDTDAGLSAGPTPKVIDAGTVELLASNRIGSESALQGGTLNVRVATLSAAQGVDGEALVDRVGGSAETGSVLEVLGVYATAASAPGPLAGVFNDAFLAIGSTSSISTVSISTPKQAKGELGFIDEGVFLLPSTFTSPERALLLPLLGDPDFPSDQRPEDPDDDAAWRAFFDDVVRPFIESRYPLAESAGDGERAAVEALVAAELRAVIAFYDRVRERERGMLAREQAEREERAAPADADRAPAQGEPEAAPDALPAAADAGTAAAATRGGIRLGHVGRSWRDGGGGVEPRGWRGPGGGWPVDVRPRG